MPIPQYNQEVFVQAFIRVGKALNKPDLRKPRLKIINPPSEMVKIVDLVDIVVG